MFITFFYTFSCYITHVPVQLASFLIIIFINHIFKFKMLNLKKVLKKRQPSILKVFSNILLSVIIILKIIICIHIYYLFNDSKNITVFTLTQRIYNVI